MPPKILLRGLSSIFFCPHSYLKPKILPSPVQCKLAKVSQIHNLSLHSGWMALQMTHPPMFGNREAYPIHPTAEFNATLGFTYFVCVE